MKENITLILLGIICMTADSPDFRAWLILTAILMSLVAVINFAKIPNKQHRKYTVYITHGTARRIRRV